MAEAAIRHLAELRRQSIDVFSRGLIAPARALVHPLAVRACSASGVHIDEGRSAVLLGIGDVRSADLILVMERAQRSTLLKGFPAHTGKVHLLGHWQGTEIEDPLGGGQRDFDECLSAIRVGAEAWLDRLSAAYPSCGSGSDTLTQTTAANSFNKRLT